MVSIFALDLSWKNNNYIYTNNDTFILPIILLWYTFIVRLMDFIVLTVDAKAYHRRFPWHCKIYLFRSRIIFKWVNAQRTLFLPPSQCLLFHSRSLKYEIARFSRKLLVSVWNFAFPVTYCSTFLLIQAVTSVTRALEQFVKPEQLDGENSYKCSK